MLTLLLACAPDPDFAEPDVAEEARMAPAAFGAFRSWFLDSDHDGYGELGTAILSRTPPPGHVDNAMDCDDDDDLTFPGAAYKEVRTTCKTDADGDGFGSMTPESGVVAGLDCDDGDETVSCVDEIHRGHDVEFLESSKHLPDYLLGSPVHVPEGGMTLTAFALIGKSAIASVKMALYSDSSGEPDELVLGTEGAAVPDGVLEIAVAPMRLSVGTYWIMAVYDDTASVGQNDPHGPSDYGIAKFRPLDFSDPLPESFGTARSNPGYGFNYYLVGY